MLQTAVTITNNSCGVVHLVGEQFNARISGYDEFTGSMPESVFDANVAKFALSYPFVEIVEGETADDGILPDSESIPAESVSLEAISGLEATNVQAAIEEIYSKIPS